MIELAFDVRGVSYRYNQVAALNALSVHVKARRARGAAGRQRIGQIDFAAAARRACASPMKARSCFMARA